MLLILRKLARDYITIYAIASTLSGDEEFIKECHSFFFENRVKY